MRTLVLVAALIVCAPGFSSAQQSDDARATADALEAIVRADYAKATALLKPLVDNSTGDVSEAAAFFLATLYRTASVCPRISHVHVRSTFESNKGAGRLRAWPDRSRVRTWIGWGRIASTSA